MSLKKKTIIHSVLAAVIVAAVFAAGLLVTFKIAEFQRDQYFDVRKYQAAATAACLDVEPIKRLKEEILAGQDVAGTTDFRRLVEQLVLVKQSDDRIRFVYIYFPVDPGVAAKRHMVFLADAENPGSKDYSAPGTGHREALPVEFAVFTGERPPDPIIEPKVSDVYGSWTSALACIIRSNVAGPGTGAPIALLGTDVDVNQALASFNQIRYFGTILDLIGAVLLTLVFAQWVFWRHNKDRKEAIGLQMRESLAVLNERLLETDRLKSEFIESASHELRGPVTAVEGALSVMERHLEDSFGGLDDISRELMEIAMTGSDRMVALVDNLLDLTRIEAGAVSIEREEVDVGRLVEEVVKLYEAVAREKDLELVADVPVEGLTAEADPQALARVLDNIVGNAVKYTGRGSITVGAREEDGSIHFTVKDTGRGIPEQNLSEIFNKFSRVHLATEHEERGTGLGLSISKGLVEAHGGTIRAESELGKGSTFHAVIPKQAPGR